ncbi:nitroreductase [Roseomonas marmotae]|uniref:Nitroreductase n=1 Tax=Roseomonas marmotae TaxID=2768161 RepID=A0ABS3KGN6_9PROT|nr:nitroreductase [Roseomonas marmotae]MBO1075501.1 nitroreductase [Roseomonas marmotae]QTI81445.1 nitroreductase [Roseomonas marmotae]
MDVFEAMATRRSLRGFLPDPVPRATIEAILTIAARAPSGSNIQPWKVRVTQGEEKARLSAALRAANAAGAMPPREYQYYPRNWREPYLSRRRKVGWDLYALAGVARGDHAAGQAQRARNFDFFGAPVGLVFTIDRDLEQGSWLDYGMFLQSIMLAARGFGLDTCPQAAFCEHHDVLRAHLGIPEGEVLVCGMALGRADPEEPANRLETERAPLSDFVRFGSAA